MLPVQTLCAQRNHLCTQLLIQYTFGGLSGRLGSVSLRPLSLQSSSVLTKATSIFCRSFQPQTGLYQSLCRLMSCFFFIKASALSLGGIKHQSSQSLVMLLLKNTDFTYRKLYIFAVTALCVLLEWDKLNRHRRQTSDFQIIIFKNLNLTATAMVILYQYTITSSSS